MTEKKSAEILEKISSGIEGFEDIMCGGSPVGRTPLLMGGPGSGKNVLALQMLVSASRHRGTPGIFVAFEENARRVSGNAKTFGWNRQRQCQGMLLR
jgi:circadian clock protein KaiC